ncbi:MAG: ABC transporter substrate-binding protein [Pseudomonadales bacterium]|nr:ABC transporter substrate-binding protein [Pseudomonadales bacterium]MBO6565179.1 ABC transporter substrate-binding protein [Pseudomonadales bacterium]MBO6595560.1 ABC transporter substrate-binding protein [Pseudomonadales bacterium]MBO6658100.1 ABC transporter substrate-binding protein [Pseudomonadales bacterium]MBO6702059.1 ABC transporter substrate-binding protein [Pseudomonadales bacterium]
MKNNSLVWAVLWLILAPAAFAEKTAEAGLTPDPTKVVSAFHDALISAMKASGYEERAAIIGPAVDANFQLHTIARISLGRNWSPLDDTQQADFQNLIRALITSTYSSRFDNFDGQYFTVLDTTEMKRNRKRVKTTLTTKSETVTLDYQLQLIENEYRIYDIVANGVSDLSLKRANYAALFKSGGLDAVTEEISRHIADNDSDHQSDTRR